ncbi:M28 family metallopeptidase [Actinomadura sp. 9N215]|uniref:M28 family metallopeptidase n=1 Tax=Actinomadura sp. 9N215 TaxID=3375150 RepID=UPI003791A986
MRTGVARPAGEPDTARIAPPGTDWARLGDTVLYWADDGAPWDAVRDRARSGGVPLEEGDAPGPAADATLVTQVGRVFQREHPDVPVLVDKGRYLVVALGEEHRARIRPREREEVCYRVEPLRPGTVVFRGVTPVAREPAPDVQALADAVSADAYRDVLTELVGFGTRHSLSEGFREAAAAAADRLRALGYVVTVAPIDVGSGRSANVVAERVAPHRSPRGVVVVTAHLDSINLAGGPAAPAPGADDNGSGAAGLLEIARVLAAVRTRHDLRLILFGGEEEGLFGSTQYVTSLDPAARLDIAAVVNMDMIASVNTPEPTVLLEGAEVSQGLIDELATAAATYTSLKVQTSLRPFNSDHVPFIDASIPAVLTIEGADSANQNVHTAGDTLDGVDEDLAHGIVRMNVATAATALLADA